MCTPYTLGGRQSKTRILSRNVDQKSIETVFSIAIFVATLATNGNRKHCFYRFLIRVCRLLRTFSIAAYPVCPRNQGCLPYFVCNFMLKLSDYMAMLSTWQPVEILLTRICRTSRPGGGGGGGKMLNTIKQFYIILIHVFSLKR